MNVCERMEEAIQKITCNPNADVFDAPWNKAVQSGDEVGLKRLSEEAQKINQLIEQNCLECQLRQSCNFVRRPVYLSGKRFSS